MNELTVKIFDKKAKKEKAKKVTDFSKDYNSIIEQMKTICIEKEAYAVAAPQFGMLERFILIMTINEVKELHSKNIKYDITSYFNPVITKMEGFQYFYEACLSVPNAIGRVGRPFRIEIEAQDIKGNKITKTAEAFEAIVLCHEIDHLDAIEYVDRAEIMYYDVNAEDRFDIRKRNPHSILRKEGEFTYIRTKQRVLKYKKERLRG